MPFIVQARYSFPHFEVFKNNKLDENKNHRIIILFFLSLKIVIFENFFFLKSVQINSRCSFASSWKKLALDTNRKSINFFLVARITHIISSIFFFKIRSHTVIKKATISFTAKFQGCQEPLKLCPFGDCPSSGRGSV